jgi:hypothetical protein
LVGRVIRQAWNSLQVGHRVLVHDDSDPTMSLVPGRVTMVQSTSGPNVITIRIAPSSGPTRVVHPRRLMVHLDAETKAGAERCWRCAAHENG